MAANIAAAEKEAALSPRQAALPTQPVRPGPASPRSIGLPAAAEARPDSLHLIHFPKGHGEAIAVPAIISAEGHLLTALLLRSVQ